MTHQTTPFLCTKFNRRKMRSFFCIFIVLFSFSTGVFSKPINKQKTSLNLEFQTFIKKDSVIPSEVLFTFVVPEDVKVKDYFDFMNNVSRAFDSILPYKLTEHILVRYNPSIIDTLISMDYYRMKLRKKVVSDQKQLIALRKGSLIYIPTLAAATRLKAKMSRTYLDINIPEYKLRIIEGSDTLYTFMIRVGQVKTQFAPTIGREFDMRTRTGIGFIANVQKKNYSFDPVDGRKYEFTTRDDGKVTMMPMLPWLEPKINGELRGQWIHATTNPRSLGKAYSNGCMGTSESDIWRIYYYAPIDTKVVIRYDLIVKNEKGEFVQLKDVYGVFTPPTNTVSDINVMPQK